VKRRSKIKNLITFFDNKCRWKKKVNVKSLQINGGGMLEFLQSKKMNNNNADEKRTGMGMSRHLYVMEEIEKLKISDPKIEIIVIDPEREYNELPHANVNTSHQVNINEYKHTCYNHENLMVLGQSGKGKSFHKKG